MATHSIGRASRLRTRFSSGVFLLRGVLEYKGVFVMKPNQVGQVIEAQAFYDIGLVSGDGFVADVELFRDGLVAVS